MCSVSLIGPVGSEEDAYVQRKEMRFKRIWEEHDPECCSQKKIKCNILLKNVQLLTNYMQCTKWPCCYGKGCVAFIYPNLTLTFVKIIWQLFCAIEVIFKKSNFRIKDSINVKCCVFVCMGFDLSMNTLL